MGPMVGIGGSGVNAAPILRSSGEIDTGSASRGGGVEAAGTLGSSQSISQIFSSVTELLQSVGGGLENDKVLRMLIALLILMAMLDNTGNSQSQSGDALRTLGSGGGSQSGLFFSYSSSVTTISIQQTYSSTTVSDAFGGSDGSSLGPGTEIDTVA